MIVSLVTSFAIFVLLNDVASAFRFSFGFDLNIRCDPFNPFKGLPFYTASRPPDTAADPDTPADPASRPFPLDTRRVETV